MSDQNVALTILAQLGGIGRLSAMIGAHSFTSAPNSLTFKWKAKASNGATCAQIILDPSDTYTVKFLSVRQAVLIKTEHEGVYADQLIDLFESETGLRMSL